MRREVQTVAVPVFQFGVYSENDLSFFAGPDFDFGGRVHSNQNIYLAQDGSASLTMRDVVRLADPSWPRMDLLVGARRTKNPKSGPAKKLRSFWSRRRTGTRARPRPPLASHKYSADPPNAPAGGPRRDVDVIGPSMPWNGPLDMVGGDRAA